MIVIRVIITWLIIQVMSKAKCKNAVYPVR